MPAMLEFNAFAVAGVIGGIVLGCIVIVVVVELITSGYFTRRRL